MANQAQVRAIYTLLGENNLRDEKESIVDAFTSGKTVSVRAMSFAQAAALIGHLKSMDTTTQRADKMRNKILSMAHEMGWHVNGQWSIVNGKQKNKIDMNHVNEWCTKYGHAHKHLDDYTYNELPKLVSQFESVYKQHLKSL